MTPPTILIDPVISCTEEEAYGPLTVHWDAPIVGYRLVMSGGHDIPVVDYMEDELYDMIMDKRVDIAELAGRNADLTEDAKAALISAALYTEGSQAAVTLDEAIAAVKALRRWTYENFSEWADRLGAVSA